MFVRTAIVSILYKAKGFLRTVIAPLTVIGVLLVIMLVPVLFKAPIRSR